MESASSLNAHACMDFCEPIASIWGNFHGALMLDFEAEGSEAISQSLFMSLPAMAWSIFTSQAEGDSSDSSDVPYVVFPSEFHRPMNQCQSICSGWLSADPWMRGELGLAAGVVVSGASNGFGGWSFAQNLEIGMRRPTCQSYNE